MILGRPVQKPFGWNESYIEPGMLKKGELVLKLNPWYISGPELFTFGSHQGNEIPSLPRRNWIIPEYRIRWDWPYIDPTIPPRVIKNSGSASITNWAQEVYSGAKDIIQTLEERHPKLENLRRMIEIHLTTQRTSRAKIKNLAEIGWGKAQAS